MYKQVLLFACYVPFVQNHFSKDLLSFFITSVDVELSENCETGGGNGVSNTTTKVTYFVKKKVNQWFYNSESVLLILRRDW